MDEDPILAELDSIRAEILAEFDGDFDAYLDHLDMVETENRKRGVRYAVPPARAQPAAARPEKA